MAKFTPEEVAARRGARKSLNKKRRALRKLTGVHVDLRKPMASTEKRRLSRNRVTVDQIFHKEIHFQKARTKRHAASLKASGVRRLKGGRFLVSHKYSGRAYLDSIGWKRHYGANSPYRDGRVPIINEQGKLEYVRATGDQWAALQNWQNVVNPKNKYYDLINRPGGRFPDAIPLRKVRFVDDEGNIVRPSMDPSVIEAALEDPEVRAEFAYFE